MMREPDTPCCQFEDEHLLVVNKPPGWNTHAPSPYAGEGIYDWLRHREPRWASLAILHRLDKDTSGLLVFGKTPEANRSLSRQFENREVQKTYRLLTDRTVAFKEKTVRTGLKRVGDRYVVCPPGPEPTLAETRFCMVRAGAQQSEWIAQPVTGRTHQIRVHAAEAGIPIMGDALYGGTRDAGMQRNRLCLHAEELGLKHPVTSEALTFTVAPDFAEPPFLSLRRACIDAATTTAYRLSHGIAEGPFGGSIDRLGEWLLWQTDTPEPPTGEARARLVPLVEALGCRGVYHQTLNRRLTGRATRELAPVLMVGEAAPLSLAIRENDVPFELSLSAGYSTGLFFDQRENRRRLLVNHVASGFPVVQDGLAGAQVLNAFAYTCGFSVCAARSGAHTTSVDLSRKALEWGQRNFRLNDLEPTEHEFLTGDVLDWFRRLRKKGRQFDLVILDPPTFSRSKKSGVFRAEKDYGRLVDAMLPLVRPGGILFASTNAAAWPPEEFVRTITSQIENAGRRILRSHFVPQPPDFPISRTDLAYLKTLWLRVE